MDFSKPRNGFRKVLAVALMITLIFVAGAIVVRYIVSSPGLAKSETVSELGGMKGASYIIFEEGTTYYAKNGKTGAIDYSGTNATQIVDKALSNANEKVFVKSGTYVVDGLKIPNGRTLEGEGWETVLYLRDGANNHVVQNEEQGTPSYGNITIRNMKIYGNKERESSNCDGISLQNISRYLIENVWIIGVKRYGIHIGVQAGKNASPHRGGRAHPCGITRCIIEQCGSDGILLGNTGGEAIGDVENIHITECLVRENGDNGIRVVDCGGVGINSCSIYNNSDNGIYFYISGMGQIVSNTISSNGKHGIRLESSNKVSVVGNGINWNNFSGIHGIRMEFDTITGNSIEESGYHGIHITGCQNTTISSNTVLHNSRENSGVYHGIYVNNYAAIATRSKWNIVIGNIVIDNSPVRQGNGIRLESGVSYNSVIGCTAVGNLNEQILDLGSNNEIHSCYNGTSWIS